MISKIFKLFLVTLFLSIVLTSCDVFTDPDSVDDPTDFTNYVLVWADEFDQEGLTPDPNFWGYDIGYGQDGWGNDEWQLYTDEPENVRVEDGNLVISTLFDSDNFEEPGKRDDSVTSARINTKDKFSMKYGMIRARIKPPVGYGMWPAFWMLGANFDTASWPYCGEIDIMEMSPLYHDDKTTMCTMHWWDDTTGSHSSYGTHEQFSYSLGEDYHIFEVEWDAQRVVGRIDGITYFVKVLDSVTMSEFQREFFIIMNVAVGGNLGGTPDDTTVWPQNMYIDWIRAYQSEESTIPIESFGIFTDETPVDAGLTIGDGADIVIWVDEWTGDLTLVNGNIPPYEGENVLSLASNNIGWFGGGIQSDLPIDLSDFSEGNLKFMIKMPTNVTFKIGIMDNQDNQSYVEFPANQTVYDLVRDGEWGQAVIPVADFSGVDISMLSYEFIILEEQGTQCTFAIDDIYYDGGGTPSSVSFDSETYSMEDTEAVVSVIDLATAETVVSVAVDNGTDTVNLDVTLDALGYGTATLNFGVTDDATDTIEIVEGGTVTASYTDGNGTVRTDTASIDNVAGPTMGIYSESHTDQMLSYSQIINSADWSGNSAVPDEMSTAVDPVDGTYVLSVTFETGGAGWGGVAFDFGSVDISSYATLVFSLDTSAMPDLEYFGIKFEDNTGGNTEINISSLTPEVTGNWAKYEIPVSQFSAVNLADIKYLGLWNPNDSGNTYLFGTIYFDDIYLED